MTRYPMDGFRLSDKFGPRVVEGKFNNHLGQDFVGPARSIIFPVHSGTVVDRRVNHNIYGNCVIVKHELPGLDVWGLYAHFSSAPLVKLYDTVSESSWLGQQGSTGFSTGDHLHLGLSHSPIVIGRHGIVSGSMFDPLPWLEARVSEPADAGSKPFEAEDDMFSDADRAALMSLVADRAASGGVQYYERDWAQQEWMIVDPTLGPLESDPNQDGYRITVDPVEARVWGRQYSGKDTVPVHLNRPEYIATQEWARKRAKEYRDAQRAILRDVLGK